MSIPKNHHYVSKCHIDNFFNWQEKKIFYYDKELNNYDHRKSTKSIFSEDFSNSRLVNGEIDHIGLEKELNDTFEKSFSNHFSNIQKIIEKPHLLENYKDSLIALTKYAIVNIMRNPVQKSNFDNTISDLIKNQIMPNATPEFAEELKNLFDYEGQTKYSNPYEYVETTNGIFDLMGEVDFTLFEITTDDYFFLTDWYSIVERVSYDTNSLARVVALVGIPLSSKTFLMTRSYRLGKALSSGVFKITQQNRGFIRRINNDLCKCAIKTIACENETYLHKYINGQIEW